MLQLLNNQLPSSIKRVSDCKAVFRSKVPRFPQPINPSLNTQQPNQYGVAFWKEQNHTIPGKLYKSINSKINKSIPSIPTWEQSYGYHYDHQSHQLISNLNPNVLITHTHFYQDQWKKTGPGYYMLRDNKPNKGLKWIPSKQKKSIDSTIQYLTEKSYQYLNQKGNPIVSKQSRFKNNQGKIKQQLLLQKIQRHFKHYLNHKKPQQFITQFQNSRNSFQSLDKTNQKSKQIQCFLSKQCRFSDFPISGCEAYVNSPNKLEQKQNKSPPKIVQTSFGVKQQRFPSEVKSKIGPGYYQGTNQFQGKKGVTIKFQAKRFDDYSNLSSSPGPSSYYPDYQNQIKKNKKVRANISNPVFHQSQKKSNSIESLYQSYGRQINCLIKVQKEDDKPKQGLSKKPQIGFLSKVSRDCIQQISKQQVKRQVDLHMISHEFRRRIIPKYPKRQYKFQKFDQEVLSPGPGDFEIAKSLLKKTYNANYQ